MNYPDDFISEEEQETRDPDLDDFRITEDDLLNQ